MPVIPSTGKFSPGDAPFYVESGLEEELWSLVTQPQNSSIFVVGRAGSGKSTLVQYVLRSYSPPNRAGLLDDSIISSFDTRGITSPQEAESRMFRNLKRDIQNGFRERGVEIDRHLAHVSADNISARDWCNQALSAFPAESDRPNLIIALDGLDQCPPDAADHIMVTGVRLHEAESVSKVIMTMRPEMRAQFNHRVGPLHRSSVLSVAGLEPVVELYAGLNVPQPLVDAVKTINAELIRELQKKPELMYELAPRRFEELIAEVLASFGWDVQLTPETKDGGYDVFAISKDVSGMKTSWIIECKRYRADRKIGVDIARSLYAVKGDLRVANAMIATTSSFTRGVQDFKTSRYDFHLSDYHQLLEWMNEYRPNPNGQLYMKENKIILP